MSSQYTHGYYCKLSITELGNFDVVETKNKKSKNKKRKTNHDHVIQPPFTKITDSPTTTTWIHLDKVTSTLDMVN